MGEIRMAGFNFAPKNWSFCDGSILNISQNTALFSILGTTYGGNGTTNFSLPNLQGRLPMHPGQGPFLTNRVLGETGGTATVTLTTQQIPVHTHATPGAAGGTATTANPVGAVPAIPASGTPYADASGATMAAGNGGGPPGISGGNQAHNNQMPYLAVTFIICLQGIFPQRP